MVARKSSAPSGVGLSSFLRPVHVRRVLWCRACVRSVSDFFYVCLFFFVDCVVFLGSFHGMARFRSFWRRILMNGTGRNGAPGTERNGTTIPFRRNEPVPRSVPFRRNGTERRKSHRIWNGTERDETGDPGTERNGGTAETLVYPY